MREREDGRGYVGQPVRRREDERFLRGGGRYVTGMTLPGMAHLQLVRSPLAHARITSIDTTAARALGGVLAVVTAADLAGRTEPMPVGTRGGAEVASVPIPLLASDRVRFAGEPVAAVVATTPAIAEDAAELVEVDYDPLPAVVDPRRSLAGEVLLHEHLGSNVLLRWRASGGDVDGAFRRAARVITGRFRIPRLAAAPIEPRAAVAAWDPETDLLTLWLSAQDPHRPFHHLTHVLRRPAERLRVIVPDVGGAFGSKGSLAPEAVIAALLAMDLRRPVKWVEGRSENFLASYQGRGLEVEAELAVDAGGRFLGLRARLLADLGAYLHPLTALTPVTAGSLVTGAYDIPAAEVELTGVATNKASTGPYRGAGRPEAAFIIERLTDLAAAELGVDPADLRRRNAIPPERFPYRTPLGFTYDSGAYQRALDRACQLLPYDRWREEQRRARAEGRLLGIGLALFIERAGPGDWEAASAAVAPDGRVVVRPGSTPHGQGHETAFAQIAADTLGLDLDDVIVEHGDTARVPEGVGTYGSRSITVGGSAAVLALQELKRRATRAAARLLGVPEGEVRWEAGGALAAPSGRVRLADLAAGEAGGLEVTARFSLPGPVFPFGAYAVVVEIDRETGRLAVHRVVAVDDAGRIVNPLLAEGQVLGSTLQGLAASLYEEVVYDEDGQLLTGSFLAYRIPYAPEAPPVEGEFLQTPSPFNPLGAKGVGESGSIAMPAAVAGAVADALAPLGIRHLDPPYTPEKLWRALRGAGPPPGGG